MRRAAKRDTTEESIINAFRAFGWSVLRISAKGAPDLLVGNYSRMALIEVKTGRKQLNARQVEWHSRWYGPQPLVFRSVEDVISFHKETANACRKPS